MDACDEEILPVVHRLTKTRIAQLRRALGEAVAEGIVDEAPTLDLSEISPTRFAGRDLDESELRERCRQAYATHYRAASETATDA